MAYKRHTIIAHLALTHPARTVPVFLTVEWDGKRLSMTGVEGPRANGDAHGSCGQLDMHEWRDYTAAPGVDIQRVRDVWARWHLNDMRAGCEHQRGPEWDTEAKVEVVTYQLTSEAMMEPGRIERAALKRLQAGESVTLSAHERAVMALPFQTTKVPDADGIASGRYEVKARESKSIGWLRPDEHPRGILTKPCAVCGYKYGSEWRTEAVPADVVAFLQSLPDDGARLPPCWAR